MQLGDMRSMNSDRRRMAFGLFGLVFGLLSLGAIGVEITKIDIRFALMVQDMAFHKIGIFSTVHGVEYGDYPSGWMIFSYLTTFGGRLVTRWFVTLPAILAGAYLVTMTCLTGERLEKHTGLLAAAFLLITPEFIHQISGFSIDLPVMAAGVTVLYLFQRGTPDRISCPVWGLLLIFCFLVRGSLGIVLLGAGAGGYLLASRRWKSVFLFGSVGLAVAVFCGVGWYWAVHYQGGEPLWQEFLRCQIGSRMDDSDYLEYFTNGMASFAPVSLLALAVFFLPRKQFLSNPVAGWLGFVLLPMVILSIPGCKHLRYIGITFPAFALLAAYAWNGRGLWNFLLKKFPRIVRFPVRIFAGFALLGIAGMVIAGCFLTEPALLPWTHFLIAALLIALFFLRAAQKLPVMWRIALPVAILLTTAMIPFEAALENSETFVSTVEKSRRGLVYLYDLGPDHDDLKYVFPVAPEKRNQIRYLYPEMRQIHPVLKLMYPYLIVSEGMKRITKDDVLILRDRRRDREALQRYAEQNGRDVQPVFSGRMGHRDFLAVKLVGKKGN